MGQNQPKQESEDGKDDGKYARFTLRIDRTVMKQVRREKAETGKPICEILEERLSESYKRLPVQVAS